MRQRDREKRKRRGKERKMLEIQRYGDIERERYIYVFNIYICI